MGKVSIRVKIIIVVLPILILTSVFIGYVGYYIAKQGITNIAKEFLGFQLNEIYKYSSRQYELAKEIGINESVINNLKQSILEYSKDLISKDGADFLVIDYNGNIDITTMTEDISQSSYLIMKNITNKLSGWLDLKLNKKDYVGVFINFSDLKSYFIILNKKEVFYSSIRSIIYYILLILSISLFISSIILLTYISYITRPIKTFVETIKNITEKMDLSKRVKIYYKDEIGQLSEYFNNMISELESSYNQIKNYAYQTVLAKKKEERIRFVFQKYVPSEVINTVLNLPFDSMLIGNKQNVTILFSDIRSFTTISESMTPEELVLSLNKYFSCMGKIIADKKGIIDKFIGDAIMAIFGAPATTGKDAENCVMAAILMYQSLKEFNEQQKKEGKIEFHIGVGINTGEAIVGNIGSENKIDYTVIGDTVNLASRLEGLTKKYHAKIIISEFTKDEIKNNIFFYRELDNVRVKGKVKPVKIYEPMLLEEAIQMKDYYDWYHKALYYYYEGNFKKALEIFEELINKNKEDYLNYMYKERCEYLIANPPENWEGVETWHEK